MSERGAQAVERDTSRYHGEIEGKSREREKNRKSEKEKESRKEGVTVRRRKKMGREE